MQHTHANAEQDDPVVSSKQQCSSFTHHSEGLDEVVRVVHDLSDHAALAPAGGDRGGLLVEELGHCGQRVSLEHDKSS